MCRAAIERTIGNGGYTVTDQMPRSAGREERPKRLKARGFSDNSDLRPSDYGRADIGESMAAIANLLTVIKGESQLLARSLATEDCVFRDRGQPRLSVIVAMVDQASVELQRLAPR